MRLLEPSRDRAAQSPELETPVQEQTDIAAAVELLVDEHVDLEAVVPGEHLGEGGHRPVGVVFGLADHEDGARRGSGSRKPIETYRIST